MLQDALIVAAVACASHVRILCPWCSSSRKKSPRDPCLSVDRADNGDVLYYCWHCSEQGVVRQRSSFNPDKYRRYRSMNAAQALSFAKPETTINTVLGATELAYLQGRGLSQATCTAAGLYTASKYFKATNAIESCIAFPYHDHNHVTGNKYRTTAKAFMQDAGGNHIFYGLARVNPKVDVLVITEGEIDALSCTEAGVENAVSVPSGAPLLVSMGKASPIEDRRFACVGEARVLLNKVSKIVLAVDNDEPGQALQEELARRIGKEKCWTVAYPPGCKDANDVLVKHGAPALKLVIDQAEPYPISGLFTAEHYAEDIIGLYNKRTGRGIDTGFAALRDLYSVQPGQLTVVTGKPSAGKSNVIDQLTINLARSVQFKTAYCSFENTPAVHIARLLEITTGKPFFEHGEGGDYLRMSEEERGTALAWINKHFTFIDFNDAEPPTIDAILMRARAAVQRMGIRGLVIDPYNYIRLERKGTETDEIGEMLSKVQAFAKANDVHVWFVAHPTKMYGNSNHPDGETISGSAAWFAKADCGITVHRGTGEQVHIDVWKCRYRWIGAQGSASIRFNPMAGTYEDFSEIAEY
jgi:twinkle protein